MCGRFALDTDPLEIERRFHAAVEKLTEERRYNVAPGQFMPIIVRKSPNKAILAKWGLIPFWSKEPKVKFSTINARAENLTTSPVYRKPFALQRCLVPTTGFFEWKKLNAKDKVPFYIHLKNSRLFAFAGLYDIWKDAEDHPLTTFTIITTEPNSLMKKIHNRMPVIFSEEDEEKWLDPGFNDTKALLQMLDPYPAGDMDAIPISKAVNNPANDSPAILSPQTS